MGAYRRAISRRRYRRRLPVRASARTTLYVPPPPCWRPWGRRSRLRTWWPRRWRCPTLWGTTRMASCASSSIRTGWGRARSSLAASRPWPAPTARWLRSTVNGVSGSRRLRWPPAWPPSWPRPRGGGRGHQRLQPHRTAGRVRGHDRRRGQMGMAFCNSGPVVAPLVGGGRVMGTNPFAWSAPLRDGHCCGRFRHGKVARASSRSRLAEGRTVAPGRHRRPGRSAQCAARRLL